LKLSASQDAYHEASATASEVVRKLAFAGIAFVWLLAGGLQTSGVTLNSRLLTAGLGLLLALALDLSQYLWKTLAWGIWSRRSELRLVRERASFPLSENEIGLAPGWFTTITWWLFALKMAAIIFAYIFIAVELVGRIRLV
jgi:hypothetical protein